MKRLLLIVLFIAGWVGMAYGQATLPPTPTQTPTPISVDSDPGTDMSAYQYGSFTIDPPSLGTLTTAALKVQVDGIQHGDFLIVYPPLDLEIGLNVGGWAVYTTNEIMLRVVNTSTGTVNGAAKVWTYSYINRAPQPISPLPTHTHTPTSTPTSTNTNTPTVTPTP